MTRKQMDAALEKAEDLYNKRLEKLHKKCKHDFERYSSYHETEYTCKKCEYTK